MQYRRLGKTGLMVGETGSGSVSDRWAGCTLPDAGIYSRSSLIPEQSGMMMQ